MFSVMSCKLISTFLKFLNIPMVRKTKENWDWVFLNSFVGLSARHMASTQDTTKTVHRFGKTIKGENFTNGKED